MTRRLLLTLISGGMLATLASCLLTANRPGTYVALIRQSASVKGAGYTTSPTANFYVARAVKLTSAAQANDSCFVGGYDPDATDVTDATVISGGTSVRLGLSGIADSLKRAATVDGTYKLSSTAGINFTPGDSATFTIMGDSNAFPAFAVVTKTAEPFTISAFTVPAVGQPLPIAWTPAAPNAAMYISLRFNDGTGTTPDLPNRQVFCALRDDGSHAIPQEVITHWGTGSAAARSAHAIRVRTSLGRPTLGKNAGGSFVNVVSTFELPTPVSP